MLERMERIVVDENPYRALRREQVRYMLKHVAQMILRIGMLAQTATAGRAFRRAANA